MKTLKDLTPKEKKKEITEISMGFVGMIFSVMKSSKPHTFWVGKFSEKIQKLTDEAYQRGRKDILEEIMERFEI